MKKSNFCVFIALAVIVLNSCGSDELLSLKDLPHEDSNIDLKLKGKGEVYIVDVNYDGKKDIIVGNEKSNKLLLWLKNENRFKDMGFFYGYPVFSPSEEVYYYTSIKDKYVWYHKEKWEDESDRPTDIEDMFEVFSEDYEYKPGNVIKAKYTIARYSKEASRNVAVLNCNDVSGLPEEWQRVVSKMKMDYHIDELWAQNEKERLRKQHEEDSVKAAWNEEEANKVYPQVCEDVWVDMGIEADDGQPLYWATSDLILRKDKTFGLSDYGNFGSPFGWGDATGMAESKNDLKEYGGDNPPHSIVGNQEYDIVTAHLKAPTRLPSKTEWMRLLDNCNIQFTTIKRNEIYTGENGLPTWAQGQWMAEDCIPKISGNALISLSIKIDGIHCSVIATQGGQVIPIYNGIYDYHKPDLIMGGLKIVVYEDQKTMITESGHSLTKVNNDTESSKIYGLMLTSKINGKKLFFPIPSPDVTVQSGRLTMEFQSAQENEYWSGTLVDDNKKCAYMVYIKGSNPVDVSLGYEERYVNKSIRPVSSSPTTVTIGTKKSSEK